tara:strand:+ start:48 stop:485 length:438 start_codon:yes stop_codon:yes gene_type:complete
LLKSFEGGSAAYRVGQGTFNVDPESYLLVNEGQRYTVEIDHQTPVSSLCLFFPPGFAEDVKGSLTSSLTDLLDNPKNDPNPVRFYERTYRLTPELRQSLQMIRDSDPATINPDGQMFRVGRKLLVGRMQLASEISRVPAARPSTR